MQRELLWELISIIFFRLGFVCINWGIYTDKFLINSYEFNSLSPLFRAVLSSPPRTFSLLNIQEGCTLNKGCWIKKEKKRCESWEKNKYNIALLFLLDMIIIKKKLRLVSVIKSRWIILNSIPCKNSNSFLCHLNNVLFRVFKLESASLSSLISSFTTSHLDIP